MFYMKPLAYWQKLTVLKMRSNQAFSMLVISWDDETFFQNQISVPLLFTPVFSQLLHIIVTHNTNIYVPLFKFHNSCFNL